MTCATRRRACVQVSVLRYYLVHATQAGKTVSAYTPRHSMKLRLSLCWGMETAAHPQCAQRA